MESVIRFKTSGVLGYLQGTFVGPLPDYSALKQLDPSFEFPSHGDASHVYVKFRDGAMWAINYNAPVGGNRILLVDKSGALISREEIRTGSCGPYTFQLLEFCTHVHEVRSGRVVDATSFANTGDKLVNHFELVDHMYMAAGMKPRT